ncbi:hypothetical protein AKO1_014089 [Acrasis kona]|uniref:Retinoblastoma-associated protein A-box domain-containing protein n=1 Tax=Acrasis kona TaxID=1008807 RepID=A0AAW2YZP2_9EUKA
MYHLFTAWLDYLWKNAPADLKSYGYGADEALTFTQIPEAELHEHFLVIIQECIEKQIDGAEFDKFVTDPSSLSKLEESYMELSKQEEGWCNDFDAKIFLLERDLVGSISKMISAPVYQLNPRLGDSVPSNDLMLSPLRSPKNNIKPKNVAHATILAIQLVKSNMRDERPEPDAELIRFFKGCSTDLTLQITHRLDTLVGQVPFDSSQESQHRRDLVKKIYYNVLRDMLQGEEKRLKEQNFTTLLTNENFHKSHIICSVETVLFAFNMRDLISFPDLLKLFKLQAFELSIIIESYVQHATWFGSAFRRHFRTVEERLFDSLCWTKDSILYTKIFESLDQIQTPVEIGNGTPIAKKKQRIFTVHNQSDNPTTKSKSIAVRYLYKKVFRLASQRIQELCAAFSEHITRDKLEFIWRVVYHVLTQHQKLMIDRHLDQMIMCGIYAVCKVAKIQISFRHIISNYRFLCEGGRSMSPVEIGKILYKVQVENESDTGDIVRFYNYGFIPQVKDFIHVQVGKTSPSNIPDMPCVQNSINMIQNNIASPHRQRVSNNLWLSPMQGSRRGSLPHAQSTTTMELCNHQGGGMVNSMTPRTKELYSFSEQHSIKRINSPSSRNVKRALDFGTEAATPSPDKRQRLNRQEEEEESD